MKDATASNRLDAQPITRPDVNDEPAGRRATASLPVQHPAAEGLRVSRQASPPESERRQIEPLSAAEEAAFAADRLLHAWQAKFTADISPAALVQAFSDWAIHLANAPGKQADLVRKWFRKALRLAYWAARAPGDPDTPYAIDPLPYDKRFDAPEWKAFPAAALWQPFLMWQQWWHNATTGVRGVAPQHEEIVRFTVRQILDAFAPSNFPWLNPEVRRVTIEQGGANLVRGFQNLVEDTERALLDKPPAGTERFQVGRDVATTPGKVIFRNRLIELIQYAPSTPTVHAEPILIVPAWIMKYYILDLSRENSLVKFLVDHGHTVFIISWRNPGAMERDFGMDDYLSIGLLKALEVVRAIVPGPKVHAVGYCLGGTLLAMAAALLAREQRDELKTVTLLAAQTDFSEAGELMLFINDSQVAYLEDIMWDQGYLNTKQMTGAFQLLRSNDLIWSTLIRQYLLGERPPMTDLLAWNADATRMPYRMHSEYLRKLFLNNDLAAGRYRVGETCCGGGLISLDDVRTPIFAVSTTTDHIAPWRSAYKINWLSDADVTFVLTTGGHNAGIVSPPGKAGREYRIAHKAHDEPALDADIWFDRAERREGSWWPAWQRYLETSSSQESRAATEPGSPDFPALAEAPGGYVREA
jgi:polyhydroxyalkanoate synthase subunit PhaC